MSTVSPQITDAVTQANVKVVAEAPAMAMGSLYQTAAHSTGLMFANAVTTQNNQNILAQAATTQGVMQIYSIDTISDAIAVVQMLQGSQAT
ncbi:RebB protein [Azorhizobium oxalatiphilum]|uniref:RebB protein n=1 Tax=Azorhizobium oxalatiphilum TaxID=980631 RepID=A0A917C5W4_9HYPH|nr:RebB family R body protein [Azorhizobium oxalatiphilum]GGF70547.1 RebB protein [Azorhizobium oxalatiphilum]